MSQENKSKGDEHRYLFVDAKSAPQYGNKHLLTLMSNIETGFTGEEGIIEDDPEDERIRKIILAEMFLVKMQQELAVGLLNKRVDIVTFSEILDWAGRIYNNNQEEIESYISELDPKKDISRIRWWRLNS